MLSVDENFTIHLMNPNYMREFCKIVKSTPPKTLYDFLLMNVLIKFYPGLGFNFLGKAQKAQRFLGLNFERDCLKNTFKTFPIELLKPIDEQYIKPETQKAVSFDLSRDKLKKIFDSFKQKKRLRK